MYFKNIHISEMIKISVAERGITPRICNFLECKEVEFQKMYNSKSLDSELFLRWVMYQMYWLLINAFITTYYQFISLPNSGLIATIGYF